MSDLSTFTHDTLELYRVAIVANIKLTFGLSVVKMKGRRNRFRIAELQPPSLEIAESVVLSWLRVSSTAFQTREVYSNAKSSAYAYFGEVMEGRSYM